MPGTKHYERLAVAILKVGDKIDLTYVQKNLAIFTKILNANGTKLNPTGTPQVQNKAVND